MGQILVVKERKMLTVVASAPKTAMKRVFLITDEDNPHHGTRSQQLLTSARTTLTVSICAMKSCTVILIDFSRIWLKQVSRLSLSSLAQEISLSMSISSIP
jgi:hypothetical protein